MPVVIVSLFIIVLEIVCFFFGASLFNIDAPVFVWKLWAVSLISIPFTGFGAVWVYNRKGDRSRQSPKRVGVLGISAASLIIGIWLSMLIISRQTPGTTPGAVLAAMSLISAFYLLSSSINFLVVKNAPTPANSVELQVGEKKWR